MRSHFGMALVVTTLGVLVAACSSSSSPAVQPEAGGPCSDTIVNVLNNNAGLLCPVDVDSKPSSYHDAITAPCASEKLKNGDIEYGQCFQYLLFEVDLDETGAS